MYVITLIFLRNVRIVYIRSRRFLGLIFSSVISRACDVGEEICLLSCNTQSDRGREYSLSTEVGSDKQGDVLDVYLG